MSTSILHIKPEEIDSVEKRGKYRVGIIGCGRNGIFHACLFAEAGFNIICADANRALVNHLTKGKSPFQKRKVEPLLKKHLKNGCLKATNDVKTAVAESDIVLLTTRAKIDRKKKVTYLDLENACKQVGSTIQRGSLVIVMSAIGPITAETLVRETLENTSGFRAGIDFGLAYNPIRIGERTLEKSAGCKRIVAATDKHSLDAASIVLGTITQKDLVRTNDVKTAEAAVLFEFVQHYANVALTSEFACFCEKAGIDYFKMKELAEANAHDTLVSPTLACRNIREEPYLLLDEAENLNVKLRIPAIAMEMNDEILKHTVGLIRESLKNCGKTLRRAKVSLLGISQAKNTKDIQNASAKKLAKNLETKGAKVRLYDPYLSRKDLADSTQNFRKNLKEAIEGVDCIVIFTGHDRFKRLNLKRLKIMARMPAGIVDLEGVVDPEKAQMEGFIYRGLGRGVSTK